MATQGTEETLRHGEGVSLGIVAIFVCQKEYCLPDETVNEVKELLEAFNLPIRYDAEKNGFSRDQLVNQCMNGRKRQETKRRGFEVSSIGENRQGIPANHVQIEIRSRAG